MDFVQNITLRRKRRTHSDSNINNTIETLSDTFDEDINNDNSITSLPDLTKQQQLEQILKLQKQLEKLQLELSSAHHEIETLSLENNELKKTNQELMNKNKLYKSITISPTKTTKSATPKKCKQKTNKQTQTDIIYKNTISLNSTPNDRCIQQTKQKYKHDTSCNTERSNVCIISSNNSNKITPIAENTLQNTSNICHYLLPNSNTKRMLSDIEIKLQHFTLKDYCIIFIGEEDFNTTCDYFDLIFYIRETLEKIKHTNVIICTPTYKCGMYVNVYNWRVGNFINLLYLDISTHEHAYFLESNENLSYDYKMFNSMTGKVNNHGMHVIFKDVQKFVNYILECNVTKNNNYLLSDNLSFFLK